MTSAFEILQGSGIYVLLRQPLNAMGGFDFLNSVGREVSWDTQQSDSHGSAAFAAEGPDWTQPLLLTNRAGIDGIELIEDGCFAQLVAAMRDAGGGSRVATVNGVSGELEVHAPGYYKWTPDAGTQADDSQFPSTHESQQTLDSNQSLDRGSDAYDSDRTVSPDPSDPRHCAYTQALSAKDEPSEEYECTQGGFDLLPENFSSYNKRTATRQIVPGAVADCCL